MRKIFQITILIRKKGLPLAVLLFMLFSLHVPQYCREGNLPQKNNKKETKKPGNPLLKEWLKEEFTIWSSPCRIKKKNILLLCGFALTTALLINNDTLIQEEVAAFAEKRHWVRSAGPKISFLGSASTDIGIIGSFYVAGVLFKNKRARKTARLGIKGLFHTMVVSQVIKHLFRRQRPNFAGGDDGWFNRGMGKEFRSFPSGHTATAWCTAAVISGMYKDKPVVPVICYSLATLVGLSRITENEHWTTDVLVGAILGYAIGRFVLNEENKRLKIIPQVYGQRVGLSLSYIF